MKLLTGSGDFGRIAVAGSRSVAVWVVVAHVVVHSHVVVHISCCCCSRHLTLHQLALLLLHQIQVELTLHLDDFLKKKPEITI